MINVNVCTISGSAVEVAYLGAYTGGSALAISAADDVTADGQTATFTLANNSGAPTGATLNGTDVGTLTDEGSGVYSYTAPLIADDATADLVVSVDSTTVSAQISYANGYPYVLTDHGTPDVNSIMEGNQFASSQPVELKIVSDFPGDYVEVDWQAMSDDQEWLTDIETAASVTTIAAGSESVTIGYFVTETGDTGTFERTVEVTEPAADTTPDAFSFTDQTDVEPESVGESNTITVSGVDAGEDIPVTITGGDYAVDAGSGFGAFTSTGTNVQLGYQIKVRNTASSDFDTATNTTLTVGGVSDTFTRTTRAAVLPTLDSALPDLDLGQGDEVSIDLDSYFSGATSYSVSGLPAGSGLSLSGSTISGTTNTTDIDASPYTVTVTATNDDGSIQDAFSVAASAPAPIIGFNHPLTTTDTSPIVSGFAGTATSITLLVNGQIYNPTVTDGAWSQQLPTLALDSYVMTLNGEDAEGNAAEEVQATLRIIEAITNDAVGRLNPFGFSNSIGF